MKLDKAARLFELMNVHPISKASHRMTLDTFQSRESKDYRYEYEYEESLGTLYVEFVLRATNEVFTVETNTTDEEGVIERLLELLPDGFSAYDLPVYLRKLQELQEEKG